MRYNPSMPSYPHIEEYRAKLQELIEFGGSDNEETFASVPELPGFLLPRSPGTAGTDPRIEDLSQQQT